MSAPWQRIATARPAAPPSPDGGAPDTSVADAGVSSASSVPAHDWTPEGGPVVGGEADVPEEVGGLAVEVAALDRLADLPVAEHVARYDALHGRLSDALSSIDGI